VSAWLHERAGQLGCDAGAADTALRVVRERASADLATVAQAARVEIPAAAGHLAAAIGRASRHERLSALELGFAAWHDRARADAALPALAEWRQFLALRAEYERAGASAGLELRRLAFPHVFDAATEVAVWLWNRRDEFVLAHALFSWLAAEAAVVGDAAAIELCARNMSLRVPTRT
jgi:hypothetical protein